MPGFLWLTYGGQTMSFDRVRIRPEDLFGVACELVTAVPSGKPGVLAPSPKSR